MKECTFCTVSSFKAGNYTESTPSLVVSDRYFEAWLFFSENSSALVESLDFVSLMVFLLGVIKQDSFIIELRIKAGKIVFLSITPGHPLVLPGIVIQ